MFSYWDIYEIIIYHLDVTHVLLFIIAYYIQFQLIYIYIIMNVVKFHQIMSVCPAKEQAYYTYHEEVYKQCLHFVLDRLLALTAGSADL